MGSGNEEAFERHVEGVIKPKCMKMGAKREHSGVDKVRKKGI